MLTPEEEDAIVVRIEAGDRSATFELVDANVGLVHSMVNRIRRLGKLDGKDRAGRVSVEDMEQEGALALVMAARGYRRGNGTKFSTYAFACITRRLNDLLAQADVGYVQLPAKVVANLEVPSPAEDRTEQVDLLLAVVPGWQREVVVRHFGLDGHPAESLSQLAASLQLSKAAVKGRIDAAFDRIRAAFPGQIRQVA